MDEEKDVKNTEGVFDDIESGEEIKAKEKKLGKSGKPRKRKLLIVLGIILFVFVAGGIGFIQWHAQPSFCGAICHTPMDSYVATYNEAPGVPGVDKYGLDIANTSGMMVVVHKEEEVDCLGCHVPTIGEQLTEGAHWISGNYDYPLTERTLKDLVSARNLKSSDEFCLNDSCHHVAADGSPINTRDDLIAATSNLARNVHLGQHGVYQCDDCHNSHSVSTVLCTQCHSDVVLPEGWLSDADYQKLLRQRQELENAE